MPCIGEPRFPRSALNLCLKEDLCHGSVSAFYVLKDPDLHYASGYGSSSGPASQQKVGYLQILVKLIFIILQFFVRILQNSSSKTTLVMSIELVLTMASQAVLQVLAFVIFQHFLPFFCSARDPVLINMKGRFVSTTGFFCKYPVPAYFE